MNKKQANALKAPTRAKKTANAKTTQKRGKVAEIAASVTGGGKTKTESGEVSDVPTPKRRSGGPQPGSGRPRKVVDYALLEKLAMLHASHDEIAAMLKVSTGYVSEHLKPGADPAFSEAHARGWSNGKLNLRRKQLEKAMGGDATMQIWLGKNMLGQTDKAEVKTHQTFSFVVDLS